MLVTNPRDVGQFIRNERRRRGWSQQFLADFAGVSAPTISDCERGYREPHLSSIAPVLAALGYGLEIRRVE